MTMKHRREVLGTVLAAIVLHQTVLAQALDALPATYAGGKTCVDCHQAETERWQGSDHDRAMTEATEATVLGDFRDVAFTAQGVTSRFYRQEGAFMVRTDGPDGQLHDYPIRYTFGWWPLQQYLIEFPGGRLQNLGIAWDSRAAKDGGQRWYHLMELGVPLLADPILAVRSEAAHTLAPLAAYPLPDETKRRLDAALSEYRETQLANAERPESHLNIGLIELAGNHVPAAEQAYRTALRLDPRFAPAYVNLADLHRSLGRDADGEAVLRDGLAAVPDDASLHHALGLLRIRQQEMTKAVDSLTRAAQLAQDNARYAYVQALAVKSTGDLDQSIAILKSALQGHPHDRDILVALVTINQERGNQEEALDFARRLKQD